MGSDGVELLFVPNRFRRDANDAEYVLLEAGAPLQEYSRPQGRSVRPVEFRSRGCETGLEAAVRRILESLELDYLEQVEALPGTPDFILPRYHAVIFAHGCYWHGHGCARGSHAPSNGVALKKRRDVNVQEELARLGYRVGTIWECALIGPTSPSADDLALQLIDFVEGADLSWSAPR
jgi:DNA mismatch endonuclease (patch repair protein)